MKNDHFFYPLPQCVSQTVKQRQRHWKRFSDLVTETKSGSLAPGKWSRSRRWFCEAICSAAASCSIQSLCQCPCQIIIIDHSFAGWILFEVWDRSHLNWSFIANQSNNYNQPVKNKRPSTESLDYIEDLLTSWRQWEGREAPPQQPYTWYNISIVLLWIKCLCINKIKVCIM